MNHEAEHHHHSESCEACERNLNNPLFCDACQKLQQITEETDYFTIFSQPQSYQVDMESLNDQFEQLIMALHPDFYSQSDPVEQSLSMEHTALLHEAKDVLEDPFLRGKYLIGLLTKDQSTVLPNPPQDFICDMFTVQEELDQVEHGQKPACQVIERISQQVKTIEGTLHFSFAALIDDPNLKREISPIMVSLSKLKFLLNLKHRADSLA